MKVVSVSQMRKLDERTIQEAEVPGNLLMEKAGFGAGKKILDYLTNIDFSHIKRLILLAGKGNNGGDIYVIAKFIYDALQANYFSEMYSKNLPHKLYNNYIPVYDSSIDILIYSICPVTELKGDAKYHAELLPKEVSVNVKAVLDTEDFCKGDIIIDGLLGTGFNGSLRKFYGNWISTVNCVNLPTIAIDIPSGLNGDTGIVSENAIKSDLTITIAQPKTGLLIGQGPEYCGLLKVMDIGVPKQYVDEIYSELSLFTEADAYPMISRLPIDCHKKTLGSVLVIGGSSLYPGAPFLAAKAALRSGAGLVTVAVPESSGIINNGVLSIITRKIPDSGTGFFTEKSIAELKTLAELASSIIIGPGMSDHESCIGIITEILTLDKTIIFDADALNIIAKYPEIFNPNPKYIFTPHPGEAKRLFKWFGLNTIVKEDRILQVKSLADKLGGTVVLKGNRTIIGSYTGRLSINGSGCQALATAGSGDVLTGIIGANSVGGVNLFDKVCLSVFVHGLAAEIGNKGMRGLIADDLVEMIPLVLKQLSPFA